ncbi:MULTISPECIES: septum site-determining protein MinC [Neobacillus]|jgi:septum site-determining protein MinC|uniref:Probable septum site-determining protein MinC n=1 Tax=Neobacillus sedimentimangrovi TaxID=2699460 RepID=A0ABS8QI05_9BACI|nr:septum site-determining protein MinC [Neobacillus sedimentimangrovi]AIM15759.1 septum formation inhibitor [Bacillus sp. X1(2014)]MCD4838707.1 septum site-determining protein MinC [Neobacillus sedimentimangrovi]
MKKRQNVTIKGTKGGLVLQLDDNCSYEELKKELDQKLSANQLSKEERHLIPVRVDVGNRYITEEQREELKNLIHQKKNLVVEEIESNVITIDEALRLKQETEVITVSRIVRSGQVLRVPGDLLLIGDVNPGGTVIAGGNIFIMGVLKGIAHAGCFGNEEAVIAASSMKPSQLRIAEQINRAPDEVVKKENREMECAYIDENQQIIIDRLQALIQLRPSLTRLEGGH